MFERLQNLMPARRKEKREIAGKIDSNRERIQELKKPMQTLLAEMRPAIESGEYSMIIGIDSSSRIPALIFDTLIKDVYKSKKEKGESGYDAPKTIFLPGLLNTVEYENKDEKARKMKRDLSAVVASGKRVLIVEDTISSGSSLKDLTDLLNEASVSFDVATVSVMDVMDDLNWTLYELKEKFKCKNLFWAQRHVPSSSRQTSISGIHRNSEIEPYKPVENKGKITRKERDAEPETIYRKTVVSARQDADTLAGELIDWYGSYKPEKIAA